MGPGFFIPSLNTFRAIPMLTASRGKPMATPRTDSNA
jgi:hypothetical protein